MGRPVDTKNRKKKKKGRPSLLDLQKRSLRLQNKHANPNPNPNPTPNPNRNKSPSNPYLRPNPSSCHSTRRNTNSEGNFDEPDDEGGQEHDFGDGSNRKEKKLKPLLPNPPDGHGLDLSTSGSDGESRKRTRKRPIGEVAAAKTEKSKSLSKAGDSTQGEIEPPVSRCGTPLPDKKLLLFILDRLQKKDTYGVFSEPVDPEELPDYHDIIEHPMDFSTIRKKLSSGAYANLEEFEQDAFLICSNAMRYNAADTVYFRQAKSIQELAKKDFQNLRQESDDEPEQKIPRRGRPPSKSTFKNPVGRSAADRASINSDATLANAPDNSNWCRPAVDAIRTRSTSDKPPFVDLMRRNFQFGQTSEKSSWFADHMLQQNEEPSGFAMRGMPSRYGKKVVCDENRRNTYKNPLLVFSGSESSVLATFDGESKVLVPVGLQIGYAYARSLARFAATLGPVAWEFASKRIEVVLPPGTKFGRGWIGEQDTPQLHQPPVLATPPSSLPPPTTSTSIMSSSSNEATKVAGESTILIADRCYHGQSMPSHSAAPSSSKHSAVHSSRPSTSDASARNGFMQPEFPVQLEECSLAQPEIGALRSGFGLNRPPVVPIIRSAKQTPSFPPDLVATQQQVPEGGSVNGNGITCSASSVDHVEVERMKTGSSCVVSSFSNFFDPRGNTDLAQKTQLQNLVNSSDSIHHPISSSFLQAGRVLLRSSGDSVSGRTPPHLITGQFDVDCHNSPNMMNAGNGIINFGDAVINHEESGRPKMLYSNSLHQENTSSHSAAMHNTTFGKSEATPNATGLGNCFTSPLSYCAGLEKQTLGNQNMSRAHCSADVNKTKWENPSTNNPSRTLLESPHDFQGSRQQLLLHQKLDPTPDLNVRFQSPTSPSSGMVVDSQQPDLVLQL